MSILRSIKTQQSQESLDAFSNMRIAQPSYIFDSQFTYDLQPILFEQITSGDGAITHNTTERAARLRINTATGSGDKAIMQSYNHFKYQSGRSQEIFISFNFNSDTSVANLKKFAEYGDGNNGIGFELNSTGKHVYIKSDTTVGDQTVEQSSWNLDKLDGTGNSGFTLDTSKTNLLIIDFQALYVGRVRVGFDIDGLIVWVHEFKNANNLSYPYIQTANLPIRVGLESTGTTATDDDMLFICSSVTSRGGQDIIGGFDFSIENNVTAGDNTRTHLLSLRPKTTFNSITNRIDPILLNISFTNDDTAAIYWELCIGQSLTTPSYSDVNATYSTMEYDTAGTLSGNPTIVINSGYVAASDKSNEIARAEINNKYPITLDAAGANRDMGTLTLLVTGIGATSDCRAAIHWKEIR